MTLVTVAACVLGRVCFVVVLRFCPFLRKGVFCYLPVVVCFPGCWFMDQRFSVSVFIVHPGETSDFWFILLLFFDNKKHFLECVTSLNNILWLLKHCISSWQHRFYFSEKAESADQKKISKFVIFIGFLSYILPEAHMSLTNQIHLFHSYGA